MDRQKIEKVQVSLRGTFGGYAQLMADKLESALNEPAQVVGMDVVIEAMAKAAYLSGAYEEYHLWETLHEQDKNYWRTQARAAYAIAAEHLAVKVPDEVAICKLVGGIFFYGSFRAETYNERELEKLLVKNGYFCKTEDEVLRMNKP